AVGVAGGGCSPLRGGRDADHDSARFPAQDVVSGGHDAAGWLDQESAAPRRGPCGGRGFAGSRTGQMSPAAAKVAAVVLNWNQEQDSMECLASLRAVEGVQVRI